MRPLALAQVLSFVMPWAYGIYISYHSNTSLSQCRGTEQVIRQDLTCPITQGLAAGKVEGLGHNICISRHISRLVSMHLPRQVSRVDDFSAICLETIDDMENIREVRCGHIYHSQCVEKWFKNGHNDCPLCKTDFLEDKPAIASQDQERGRSALENPAQVEVTAAPQSL
jgi:hypothetical protein